MSAVLLVKWFLVGIYLMRGHIADADISVREVGAQLLGLHSLSSGEATAEAKVDVAVAAVPTLLACNHDVCVMICDPWVNKVLQNIFARTLHSPNGPTPGAGAEHMLS